MICSILLMDILPEYLDLNYVLRGGGGGALCAKHVIYRIVHSKWRSIDVCREWEPSLHSDVI